MVTIETRGCSRALGLFGTNGIEVKFYFNLHYLPDAVY